MHQCPGLLIDQFVDFIAAVAKQLDKGRIDETVARRVAIHDGNGVHRLLEQGAEALFRLAQGLLHLFSLGDVLDGAVHRLYHPNRIADGLAAHRDPAMDAVGADQLGITDIRPTILPAAFRRLA